MSVLREALCRECSACVYWVTVPELGGAHPVDYVVQVEPLANRVAVNPRSGGGRLISLEDVESGRAARWVEGGAEIRVSHFATCPARAANRNPNQEAMF